MELRDALVQITEIRSQIARTEVFRGYRSLTVGFSGALGILAACYQARAIPDPAAEPERYLRLWVGVAAISLIVVIAEMVWRCWQTISPRAVRLTWLAVEQFAPCLIAGGLVTAILPSVAPDLLWLMPSLWAMLFSLGVFASSRLLPRPTIAVAAWYLLAGVSMLALGPEQFTLSPGLMGITFGGGQLLASIILYWTLERNHGQA
ncbi:hypothetical protein [Planctomicrobium piriforme]|uniref:Uncharacterized protein n=1 Tax=Planctomicrobium piriforme TaxID=1576369 RepID=A0A1I3FY93_9PLAN|nr:hypothetical protein [Planctomicrobium piriforme]SFI16213.1 hypothetical protein SAMN05421753_10689 [Planctomicrobium piriforme]